MTSSQTTTTITATAASPGIDNSKMTLTPWNKPTLTILLVGETDVGKTAFLDLLANVCAGRSPEQFTKVHIESNENAASTLGSHTNLPSLYKITCANGREVRVLDTPGLADARGTDFDDEHRQAIDQATLSSQIEFVDSVIIVADGTTTRLGVAAEYALTVVAAMFPKSIADNIGLLFTKVTDPLQFNLNHEDLPVALRNATIWAMDNPLVGWFLYQSQLHSETPQAQSVLDGTQNAVTLSYGTTLTMLNSFFKWQDSRTVQPTKAMDELYQMSTRIEASIANVLAQLSAIDIKKTQLSQLDATISSQQKASDVSQSLIEELNKNFQTIIDKSYYQLEDTTLYNVICFEHNCYKNCYQDGTWTGVDGPVILGPNKQVEDIHYIFLKYPAAPEGGLQCRVCKHSSIYHQHVANKWVLKPDVRTTIDPAAKAKYDAAKQAEGEAAALSLQVNDAIAGLQRTADSYEDELGELCTDFNNLVLSASFVQRITTTIALLQMRHDALVKQGASTASIDLMTERIASMGKKRQVLQDALAENEKESQGDGGFITTGGANVKSVALGPH